MNQTMRLTNYDDTVNIAGIPTFFRIPYVPPEPEKLKRRKSQAPDQEALGGSIPQEFKPGPKQPLRKIDTPHIPDLLISVQGIDPQKYLHGHTLLGHTQGHQSHGHTQGHQAHGLTQAHQRAHLLGHPDQSQAEKSGKNSQKNHARKKKILRSISI